MTWLRRFLSWSAWWPATVNLIITAAGLLADAYARTGQLERAEQLFAEVTQISTTPETLYNYASFLKTANRREEAREWAQKLLAKKRTLPRYMQRRERPWFRKGKALVKELATR